MMRKRFLLVVGLASVLTATLSTHASESKPPVVEIALLTHAELRLRGKINCTAFQLPNKSIITSASCLPEVSREMNHLFFGNRGSRYDRHVMTRKERFKISPDGHIAISCVGKNIEGIDGIFEGNIEHRMEVTVDGYFQPNGLVSQTRRCQILLSDQSSMARLDCPLTLGSAGAPVRAVQSCKVLGIALNREQGRTNIALLDAGIFSHLCQP